MNTITPFLWFNDNAEEAIEFYVSVFPNARKGEVRRFGPGLHMPEGSFLTGEFEIAGQKLIAMNGGPHYSFTPAISLAVDCASQEEVDTLWEKLGDGGTPLACGWITDRFGVTWQIVPGEIFDLIYGPDAEAAQRATQCMLGMVKLDIEEIRKAYAGE